MIPAGPGPFGDGPIEPDSGDDEEQLLDDLVGQGPDRADDPDQRGWLPPEDRLWRHPSELASPAGRRRRASGATPPGRGTGGIPALDSGPPPRRHAATTTLVGTGAAVAVAIALVLLVTASSGPVAGRASRSTPSPATLADAPSTPGPSTPADRGGTPGAAGRAVVELEVRTPRGVTSGCAVAVAEGGLVVTTGDVVAGASSVTAVTATGRHAPARVVAVDPNSDIALLQVDADLPVPRFVPDSKVSAGRQAMLMRLSTGSGGGSGSGTGSGSTGTGTGSGTGTGAGTGGSGTSTAWSLSTIVRVGSPVRSGAAAGLSGISATAATADPLPGAVLVRPDGAVIGILDKSASADEPEHWMFLPTQLVLGVAGDLASDGRVRHGWLGVGGRDGAVVEVPDSGSVDGPGTSERTGALVTTVDPDGPSAGILQPGDLILTVSGEPVRSWDELHERLYVLPPNRPVRLQVVRGGTTIVADVDLGESP